MTENPHSSVFLIRPVVPVFLFFILLALLIAVRYVYYLYSNIIQWKDPLKGGWCSVTLRVRVKPFLLIYSCISLCRFLWSSCLLWSLYVSTTCSFEWRVRLLPEVALDLVFPWLLRKPRQTAEQTCTWISGSPNQTQSRYILPIPVRHWKYAFLRSPFP